MLCSAARLAAHRCRQLGVARVTVEDHLLGGPVRGQDGQHVVVRVAVVDHQRLASLLGDVDVRPEPVPLDGRRCAVPVVVEPSLADSADLRQRGEPGDLGQHGVLLRRAGRSRGGLLRVDGHRGVDVVERGCAVLLLIGTTERRSRPSPSCRCRMGSRLGQHLGHRLVQHVQVAVAVEGRRRQWLRRPRARLADAGARSESGRLRPAACPDPAPAAELSVTCAPCWPVPRPRPSGSSFGNSGTGGASAVPGRIGSDSQRGGASGNRR